MKKNFKPAGVIAALALGIPIIWKGKDVTKYVKDRIGKKKKKPVENKKQSNPQNNGNQKPEQSEIKKDTNAQAQPPQEDANDKKSEGTSGKKQDAPVNVNKQNDAKVENIKNSDENSIIDAAAADQDFDKFMDELFGNDHSGEGLTVDDVFNNDIEYSPERFKNVSKIIPIPFCVTYDTFAGTLFSSISISAYIDLYNKLFNDLKEYVKSLKDYIVKKKRAPDDNNIKLTEPNIKKTITDYFEDVEKKPGSSHSRIEFTKINDEIIKIEKQTKDIDNEINKYLLDINSIHSFENDQNIMPNNYNEIINTYDQAINECINILNTFIDIMNEWLNETDKTTRKLSEAVFYNDSPSNKSKSSQDTSAQNKNNSEKKKPTAVVQEADDKIKNLLKYNIKDFIQKNPGTTEQYKDGKDILTAIDKLFDGEYSDKKKNDFTFYIEGYQKNLLDHNETNTIVNFHKMLVDKCGFIKRDEVGSPINESDFKNGILADELTLKLKFDKIGSRTLMVKGVYKPNSGAEKG